jgi:hypothetical protein
LHLYNLRYLALKTFDVNVTYHQKGGRCFHVWKQKNKPQPAEKFREVRQLIKITSLLFDFQSLILQKTFDPFLLTSTYGGAVKFGRLLKLSIIFADSLYCRLFSPTFFTFPALLISLRFGLTYIWSIKFGRLFRSRPFWSTLYFANSLDGILLPLAQNDMVDIYFCQTFLVSLQT